MSHIFISYSRKDLDFAKRIVQALKENSLDVWIDWMSIWKGDEWKPAIYRGIEEADAFLFLISPDSVISNPCNEEITYALENNKLIIPIVIRDAKGEAIREELSKLNWIFCRYELGKPEVTLHNDDFTIAIEEVRKAIHTDYEWLKYQARLQVRALDWGRRKHNSRLLRGKDLREAEEQLATVGSKDPQPTDLQRQYVLASRIDESRKRRLTTIGLTIGFAVMSVLCIAAVVSSFIAVGQRNQAISNENARATAQANAEEQANIALARQLAAQAQLLFTKQDNSPLVATLLAIESKQRFPNSEADEVIRNSIDLLLPLYTQIPTSHTKEITNVAVSSDGNYIASGGSDNTARIWDIDSGKEISNFQISGQVTYMRFSPDSKLLYVQSNDGYVRSWDIKIGNQILEAYHGESSPVFDLSANGKIAVSSGMDGIVLIWNTETGREIVGANHNNNKAVNFVAISPDGTRVASVGSEDTTVKIWDSQNGRLINQKSTETTPWAVAFSPDSQRIISNTGSNSELWDVNTGEEITKIDTNSVGKYLFSPNGQFIATLSVNAKKVEVWNAETGELVTNLPHEFFVFSVAFSPDGKYVASGSADGVIKLWDPITGQEVGRIIKSGTANIETLFPIMSIAFSPNSDLIASPVDNTIYLWRIPTFGNKFALPNAGKGINTRIDPTGKWIASGKWTASFDPNQSTVKITELSSNTVKAQLENQYPLTALNFSPDGSMLITADEKGYTCVWEIPNGGRVVCFPGEGRINIVVISPDSNLAAAVQNSGLATEYHLTVWNIQTGEKIFEITPGFLIQNATFSKDSRLVAIAGIEDYVGLWDITSQKEIGQLRDYYPLTTINANNAIIFSSDGKWLIISDAGSARVWNLSDTKEISHIAYEADEYFNLHTVLKTIISPDRTKLASVNTVDIHNITFDAKTKREATILIWDPLSGKEIVRMVHNSWVNDIIWSPDGKYVLSGGQDGVVRIWDANNGNEVGAIIHDSPITQLQFAPNGDQIISISDDGIYKISYLGQGDIILKECSPVTRNLSLSEWIQYFGDISYHATCPNLPTPTN